MSTDPDTRTNEILAVLRSSWRELSPTYWISTYQIAAYRIVLEVRRNPDYENYFNTHFGVTLTPTDGLTSPDDAPETIALGIGNAGISLEEAQENLEETVRSDILGLVNNRVIA